MSTPAVELELDFLVWKDKNGTEQVTPAHTFESGTTMLFQQSAAPVGWTKSTTHDNKALRVTSGTAASGGNSAFNTVFGRTATDNHTLTAAQMPSHSHSTSNTGYHSHSFNRRGLYSGGSYTNDAATGASGSGHTWAQGTNGSGSHSHNTNNAGSSQGHSHGIDLRVQYIDVIVATKD